MSKDAGNCNCLVGTPMIDNDGNCHCVETATNQIIRTGAGRPPVVVNNTVPVKPAEADNTIFGLPPLVVLAGVVAGLYFLSANDKGTK